MRSRILAVPIIITYVAPVPAFEALARAHELLKRLLATTGHAHGVEGRLAAVRCGLMVARNAVFVCMREQQARGGGDEYHEREYANGGTARARGNSRVCRRSHSTRLKTRLGR